MESSDFCAARAPRTLLVGLTLLACSTERPTVPDATGGSAPLGGAGVGGASTAGGGYTPSSGGSAVGGAGTGPAGAGGLELGGGGLAAGGLGGAGGSTGGAPASGGFAGSAGLVGAGGFVGSSGGTGSGEVASGGSLNGVGSATGESAGFGGGAGSAAGAPGACGNVPALATFAEVKPILTTSCGTGGCHPSRMGTHVNLRDMDGMLHTRLLGNVPTAATMEEACLNRPLVVPCKPEESLLLAMIGAADAPRTGCGVRMPDDCPEDDNPCLPDAEIETIRSWIAAGALP